MHDEIQILNEIEKAAGLCKKEYSHSDIIDVMKTENDFEKQICILKLQKLESQEEADLLIFQLTGHHGLIREAAAAKISEFILNNRFLELFLNEKALTSLLKTVNDINPNICRMICSALPNLLTDNNKEKQIFLKLLYQRFDEVFEELERLKRSNWYTKKLFNLYWCLEALAMTKPPVDIQLEKILEQASKIRDYTIREKTAFVLSKIESSSSKLNEIKSRLKTDDNFYVKRYSKAF